MDVMLSFLDTNAFWVWLGIGGVLLAIEIGTGSGWLLWPAGSAAVTAVLSLFAPFNAAAEIGVVGALTIASTLAGRRYLSRTAPTGPDINDTTTHLIGHSGLAVHAFHDGHGRVVVDGKEWQAELEGAITLDPGARVEVTDVLSGARVRVRAA